MSDEHRFERDARAWLELGPTDAPDRVVEAALLEIEQTSQERVLWIPWRLPTMTPRLGLVATALVAVVAVGLIYLNLPGRNANDVGAPSATPSLSAPTSTPGLTSRPSPVDYSTIPGWIVFEHFGQAPDGSTTTFDPDLRQIWLVRADGTGLHELAPGTTAGKSSPDISPDGTKVIFNSWDGARRIYEVSIEGGEPVLVSTDCPEDPLCDENDPSYSPDGGRVAFMRIEGEGATQSAVIGIRDLGTHQVTLIESTRVLLETANLAQPTWSPDGTQIAYHRNTQTASDERPTQIRINVVNTDGTGLHELPAPDGEAKAGDPDWSPDGSLIVFSTMPNREGEGDENGHPGVYTIHPDGTGLTDVCGACLGGGIAPSWTPDGTHILVWGFRTWALVEPDGSNMAHINQSKLTWYGEQLGYGYFALLQPTP